MNNTQIPTKTLYNYSSPNKNFQKTTNKPQILNTISQMSEYLNFNRFEFLVVRQNNMCDKHYFRITNPQINPTYLYWHIVQDFQADNIRRLAGRDYLGLRNIANHLVYISGQPYTLMSIGQFVNNGRQANISIGKYPHNFGEVSLINTKIFHQVRNKVN